MYFNLKKWTTYAHFYFYLIVAGLAGSSTCQEKTLSPEDRWAGFHGSSAATRVFICEQNSWLATTRSVHN